MIVGFDHRGKDLADRVLQKYIDSKSFFSTEYPDVVAQVLNIMKFEKNERAILICKTGVGMSIGVNRHSYIRAALVCDIESTKLARAHNNANVICLGSATIRDDILKIVEIFLTTEFDGGRHANRLSQI